MAMVHIFQYLLKKTKLKLIQVAILTTVYFGIKISAQYTGFIPLLLVDGFLSENLIIIFSLIMVFFLADIFSSLPFPVNFAYPILHAVGLVIFMVFLLNIAQEVNNYIERDILGYLNTFFMVLTPVLFIVIIVTEYAQIFQQLRKSKKQGKIDIRGLYK